jgi:hypothetical protein
MYQRLEFGADAKAFIRLQLSTGPTLSRFLCELPLEQGRVVAFLPPTVQLWNLLHFAWPINSPDDLLYERVDGEYREREHNVIADFLKEGYGKAAVFYKDTFPPGREAARISHDAVGNWLCEIVHSQSSSERVFSTEQYFVLKAPLSKDKVLECLKYVKGASKLIGTLLTAPEPLPRENGLITRETLQAVASRTEMIFVSAYDRDATLIWSRTTLP